MSVDGPNPAIIMEFCAKGKLVQCVVILKGSLDKIVYSTAPMSPAFVDNIIKGTALGLLHLHNNGLIHRDIATRNVLVCIVKGVIFS